MAKQPDMSEEQPDKSEEFSMRQDQLDKIR